VIASLIMRLLQTALLLPLAIVSLVAAPVTASDSHTTISVRFDDTKPSSLAWDFGNPLPDPYVVVDGKNFRRDRCEDSLSCSFTLSGVDEYYDVAVYDADLSDDDYAGTVRCRRGYKCETGRGATVTIF
jgi:hypothetical protein